MFQTIKYVWSIKLCLKYQRGTPSGFKDTGIRNFEFVAKTQFLSVGYFNQSVFAHKSKYLTIKQYAPYSIKDITVNLK